MKTIKSIRMQLAYIGDGKINGTEVAYDTFTLV